MEKNERKRRKREREESWRRREGANIVCQEEVVFDFDLLSRILDAKTVLPVMKQTREGDGTKREEEKRREKGIEK